MSFGWLAHHPIEHQTGKEPIMAHASLTTTPVSARSPPVPVVLALDLGTTTGRALRAPDGLITSGTVSFRPSRYDGGGMRYLRFRAGRPAGRRCRIDNRHPLRGGAQARRHRRGTCLWRAARHADGVGRAADIAYQEFPWAP